MYRYINISCFTIYIKYKYLCYAKNSKRILITIGDYSFVNGFKYYL